MSQRSLRDESLDQYTYKLHLLSIIPRTSGTSISRGRRFVKRLFLHQNLIIFMLDQYFHVISTNNNSLQVELRIFLFDENILLCI